MILSKMSAALGVVALAGALLVTAAPTPADAQAGSAPTIGAYAQPINGQSNIEAVQELERTLGTTVPIVRGFNDWDDTIGADKPLHTFIRDGGRELAISVKPTRNNGTDIRWAEIANAQPGSTLYRDIQNMADALNRYGAPVIFTFHHEPEQNANTKFGTADEFRAAFRKIHSIFDAEGVDNVRHSVVLTEWSFEVGDFFPDDRRRAELWYPGDDVVDIIGSDEYNWNGCRNDGRDPWISLEDDIEPFLRFARQHPNQQLMLGEFGSDEGSPGQKAQWLSDAEDFFANSPDGDRFVALLYFHDDGREEGWPECEWWLDSTSPTTGAAIDWFNNERFRGSFTDQTSPAPPAAPLCNGRRATIVGTAGADVLVGTTGNDVIVGLGGNDDITGLTGDDIICGGPGDDTIRGLGGADVIFGEGGADFILGGFGPDFIAGGLGPDRINGQFGNDEITGGQGNDVIRGGPHQDLISGGDHADLIYGQGGFDVINGGLGDDRLLGGVGADTLTGGIGRDICTAGLGRDSLNCEVER